MTIAELRAREVHKLARWKTPMVTLEDIDAARRIMNSFYRLCGLLNRLLILENDERTCNRRSTREASNRALSWTRRLNKELEPYGLALSFSGYLPSIGTKDPISGAFSEKIFTYFYDR